MYLPYSRAYVATIIQTTVFVQQLRHFLPHPPIETIPNPNGSLAMCDSYNIVQTTRRAGEREGPVRIRFA